MKRVFSALAFVIFAGTQAVYAGNGDLTVSGKLGVGTTTPGTLLYTTLQGSNYGDVFRIGNM